MTTANQQHVNIVISAVDRVTRTVRDIRRSLMRDLRSSIRSTVVSFLSLTTVAGALGLGLTQLIGRVRSFFQDIRKTNQALARVGINLRTAGFNTDRMNTALQNLRDSLSRTAIQALGRMSTELQVFASQLQPATLRRLEDMAKQLSDITGIEMQVWLEAMIEGLRNNLQPLKDLGIEADNSREAFQRLSDEIQRQEDNRTALERVGDFFARMWDQVTERTMAFVNQLAESVVTIVDLATKIGEGMTRGVLNPLQRLDIDIALLLVDMVEKTKEVWGLAGTLFGENLWTPFIAFITETLPGWFVKTITETIPDFFTDTLPMWIAAGIDMAQAFVKGFIDGLRRHLQRAANWAINQINRLIGVINSRLRRIGLPTIPTVPGFTVGAGPDLGGSAFQGLQQGGAMRGGGGPTVINVSLGGRAVGQVILDEMNHQVRTREPTLGIA